VRTTLVDIELANAIKDLLALDAGGRLFRYEREGELVPLTAAVLNEYVQEHLGDEFSSKDFRTWGGTLLAAIALAEHGPPQTQTEAKRTLAAVMRTVGERLGNTPSVARSSYVSPAVVEQYLDGRTIDDFRPRHLRIVSARDIGLDPEEQALVSLLRSWRMRRARQAA
jgi:DNA topoisomerase-1